MGEIAQLYLRNRPTHDTNARRATKANARPELAWPPVLLKDEPVKSSGGEGNSSSAVELGSKGESGKGKGRDKEKEGGERPKMTERGRGGNERTIVIDADDDDDDYIDKGEALQHTGPPVDAGTRRNKRPNSDASSNPTRATRPKTRSGQGSSNAVIELD